MNSHSVLNEVFGYSDFRFPQGEIIDSILSGQDTLAILPTGAGKSLCYQVPALLLPGLTIVVSPLLALMSDQVESIQRKHISAATWNSTTSDAELAQLQQNLRENRLKILYLSPEKLKSKPVQKALQVTSISHLCVDEAHCISQWGHEFRPEYRGIQDSLQQIVQNRPRPVISAFTATAPPKVARDISQSLRLYHANTYSTPFWRPNLRYAVFHPESEQQKRTVLLKLVHEWWETGTGAGIVYVSTRHQADFFARWLQQHKLPAHSFHAGYNHHYKSQVLQQFLTHPRALIVTTSAFGMGVDKPNVRLVIHHSPPVSLAAYAQEAGRAGRDELPATCILLYRPEDLHTNTEFTLRSVSKHRSRLIRQHAYEVHQYAQSRCRARFLLKSFSPQHFWNTSLSACHCDHCLPIQWRSEQTQFAHEGH